MSGRVERSGPTVLLADAGVLIDYRDSSLEVLKLVGQHIARVAVVSSVLDEVRGVSREDCAGLGIDVLEVKIDWLLEARDVESRASFNDRLCCVVCREHGWTCVTNDAALGRLCERHGVKTRRGLGLMVDLVRAGGLASRCAAATARKMQKVNPLHINERVVTRFLSALDSLCEDRVEHHHRVRGAGRSRRQ